MGIIKNSNNRKFKKIQKSFALLLATCLIANSSMPAALATDTKEEVVVETSNIQEAETTEEMEAEETEEVEAEETEEVEAEATEEVEAEEVEATEEVETEATEEVEAEATEEVEVEATEEVEVETTEEVEAETTEQVEVEATEEVEVETPEQVDGNVPGLLEVENVSMFPEMNAAVFSNSVTAIPTITYGGGEYKEGATITVDNMDSIYVSIAVNGLVNGGDIQIDIPVGLQLVSASGVDSVANTSFTSKDYSTAEGILFGSNTPSWNYDAGAKVTPLGSTVYPKSGVLSYSFAEGTGSGTIFLELSANASFVNTSATAITTQLEDLTIYVETYNGARKNESSVGVELVGKATNIEITGVAFKEYVSTLVTNAEACRAQLQTTIAEGYTDTLDVGYSLQKDVPITGYAANQVVYGISIEVDVPKGATITAGTGHSVSLKSENDTTTTYYIKSTATSHTLTYDSATRKVSGAYSNAFKLTLPSDIFKAGTYTITASNLTLGVSEYDSATNVINNLDVVMEDEIDTTVQVVSPINSSAHVPTWTSASASWEEFNYNTGEDQLLYTATRSYGNNRTNYPVTFEFVNNQVEGQFLDNVSKVMFASPMLGEDGYYTAKIKSVTVKYEGKTAVTTYADGDGYAPSYTSGSANIASYAGGTYSWTGSGTQAAVYYTFEAPEGESFESIKIAYTGDNVTGTNSNTPRCYVYGTPKSDTSTANYSSYQFKTTAYEEDGVTVRQTAESTAAGFRWKASEPFSVDLEVKSLDPSMEYTFNTASLNSYYPISNISNNPTGYLEMAAASFANLSDSGMPDGANLVIVAEMDTEVNVIKRVVIPVDRSTSASRTESLNNIKTIEWTYVGESVTHSYNRDRGEAIPYKILTQTASGFGNSNGYLAYIDAAEGKEFASIKITYDDWVEDGSELQLNLKGYIKDHNLSLRTSAHKFTVGLYEEQSDGTYKVQEDSVQSKTYGRTYAEATEGYINMVIYGTTATNIPSLGAASVDANVLKVGETSSISYQVYSGSNNQYYRSRGVRDITMDITLPEGIHLEGAKAREVMVEGYSNASLNAVLNNAIKDTVSSVTIEEFTLSASEASEYFGTTVGGGTRYRITMDDEFIRLYPIYFNSGYRQLGIMFDLEVSADYRANGSIIPWSDFIAVGTGATAMKTLGTRGSSTSPTHGQFITNPTGDRRIGESNNIMVGSSQQYLYVESVPAVLISNSHVEYNEDKYTYREDDKETIAVLGEDDEFSINYTIINNIIEDSVDDRTSYVFLSIPTMNSLLVEELGFDVELKDILITPSSETTGATYTIQYINLTGTSIGTTTAQSIYEGGSSTYDSATHNAIAIKVEDQKMGETAQVTMNMNVAEGAPITGIDEFFYIELEGISVFNYDGSASTSYNSGEGEGEYFGNNPIKFAYNSPEWQIKAQAMIYDNGVIESLDDSKEVFLSVRDRYGVYSPTVTLSDGQYKLPLDKDMNVLGYTFMGYSSKGWFQDEALSIDLLTIDGNENNYTRFYSGADVYAKYTPDYFTVRYNLGEYKELVSYTPADKVKSVTWKESGLIPSGVSVLGKTLDGWFTEPGEGYAEKQVTNTTPVQDFYEGSYGEYEGDNPDEIVLTPKFTDKEYKITYSYVMPEFAPEFADVTKTGTVKWDDADLLDDAVGGEYLGDATSAWYRFEAYETLESKVGPGWYADKACTIPIDKDTLFSELASNDNVEGITIYLKYNAVPNTVRYIVTPYDGAPSFTERTNIRDDNADLLPKDGDNEVDIIRYGYNYLGWFTTSGTERVESGAQYQELVENPGDEILMLYTKFSTKDYTVSYDLSDYTDATLDEKGVIWSTSNLLPTTAPSVAGMTFQGWYTQAGGKGIQLDATYTEGEGDDEVTLTKSYEYGELVLELGNMDLEADGAKLTLYPYYTPMEYAVAFLNGEEVIYSNYTETEDGYVKKDQVLWTTNLDTIVSKVPAATQKGATFSHWEYTGESNAQVKLEEGDTYGDVALGNDAKDYVAFNAVFEYNKYTVNFDLGEFATGDIAEPDSLTGVIWTDSNLMADAPELPGYTFVHWYMDAAGTVQADRYTTYAQLAGDNDVPVSATVYAKYVEKEYYVSYDLNYEGAPTVEVMKDMVVWTEDALILDTLDTTRTGYTFNGWYTDASCTTLVEDQTYGEIAVDASLNGITLYAGYAANEYTVTYITGDGEVEEVTVAIWDVTDIAEAITRPGYTFNGWFLDEEFATKVSTGTTFADLLAAGIITGDDIEGITLYASWSLIIDISVVADLILDATDGSGTAVPPTNYGITSYTVEDLVVENIEIVDAEDWVLTDNDDCDTLAGNELYVEFKEVRLDAGDNTLPEAGEDDAWIIEAGQGTELPIDVLMKYSTSETPSGKVKLFNALYTITAVK